MPSTSALYPLARSFKASARLNLQHFLHRKDVGWLVHPSISIQSLPSPRVADVGAGTGIWLIDLSDELPKSAMLEGFDISNAQYPHDDWLPPNVRLGVQDIFADIPAELTGKFDLVNIRYFLLVVRDNDPRAIIENAFNMLKPGGRLQWVEYDGLNGSNVIAPGVDEAPWQALLTEVEVQTRSSTARFQWLDEMVNLLEKAGFTNVTKERRNPRKHNYAIWQQLTLGAAEEMSYSTTEGDKIRDLIARNQNATPQGVCWMRPHLTFIARKPL